MAFSRGPNIVTDGLVFGYDTGYPLVSGNSDTYKFNLGEPTTNLVTNPIFVNDTLTGWTSTGNSSVSNGIATLTGAGPDTSLYIYQDFTFGASTVILSYESRTVNASDESGYGDSGARIRFDGTKVNSVLASDTEWTKYTHTISHDGSARLEFSGHDLTAGSIFQIRNIQLEQKSHATPFTTGTRSSTQSLIDLTRTRTIDVSNVSFDSNAQMTFDGTDDMITLQGTENFQSQSPFTLEIWTYVTAFDVGGSMFMFQQNSGTYGGFEFWSQTSGAIRLNANGSINLAATPSGAFTSNNWNHVVATVDGTTASIYVNGELKVANSAGFPDSVNGNIKVGDWALPGYRVNGDIPIIKIYNTALTSEEVQQNYNATKSRFGL